MKVLLRSDVEGVGRRGDIVEVSGGFARNYLLPEGRALLASDGVVGQAASMRRSRDMKEAKDRDAAQTQVSVLAGAVLRIEARAGTAGKLFGSVSAADVADAVKAQKGVELARHHVVLEEPIKAVGTYEVPVQILDDIATTVSVEVVAAG